MFGCEPGADPQRPGVVAGDHDSLGGGVSKLHERLVERLVRAVVVQVVGIHVGDQRDRGVVQQERAIGFVGLDDEEVAGTRRARRTELLDHTAVDEVRVGAELTQRRDDHARRRRLSVRTCDRDEATGADQPVQCLRTMDHVESAGLRRHELGILGPDRARVHDRVGVAEMGGVVTDVNSRSRGGQCPQVVAVGTVAAGDPDTGVEEHLRETAHAGTADADEVRGGDRVGNGEGEVGSDHVRFSLLFFGLTDRVRRRRVRDR